MEPVGKVFDNLKGFAKSSQDFVDNLIHRRERSARRNPIEILKRLQREAFSDLMKLRDRQDKVERVLSFYKPSRGGPFQEATTLFKGQVDILGALLMMDNSDEQNLETISRAGIKTGVDSRFTFETTFGQKDTLVAEFVSSNKGRDYLSDVSGSPLSLEKVKYMANISNWLSAVAIPMGAQCRDVGNTSNSNHVAKGLTDFSSFEPPLLNLHNGSAIGITVKKSNIIASLAQFISGLGIQSESNSTGNCSSLFGQVVCQFPRGIKLSLLGLHQVPLSFSQHINLGALTVPVFSTRHQAPERVVEAYPPHLGTKTRASTGYIALMLETELDDITRIGGWIEMNKTNSKHLQWAVTMSDVSEDSLGWGLSLSGMIGDSTSRDHFQAESYVKFNLGSRFSLKPGLAYVTDGNSKVGALMLRSNWCL
ncbi:GDSL esterase/lipase [Quillaja saponaria]|uniref:GDSL esterase/lipase n=1 Tax=Quillaja saponaria TaxID=32244 RepID=A0AAD7PJW6_QUISA|nr:GDSL esterase/lipase [Quillaja saponaria]